ncbi:holliday junction resolvase [Adoxophyes honmai entomopoxvirus 'L']|uniref:Holliday junction resolvase n=1 Tax=Adoxophyes honmai entomopoxvirus 'L' TaxID=1293540 RepID=A0A916KP78_9POXV|nr:holliday junction resolvase [Adoxophyes honmai entomopoxvirus 'L']CCU55493.1 holliday junction resolvase [Adoxophyes honmai entomopoxvirus 'L']
MLILSIDVGIKNLGLSIISCIDNKCNIICIKANISNISYEKLNKLYDKHKMHTIENVIIEQQYRGRKNIYFCGFICSFFQSKNKPVYSVKPYTYNMHIKSYNLRKKHTLNIFKNLITTDNLSIISDYDKYDDIADATCIGLKWLNLDVNNIIVESMQII